MPNDVQWHEALRLLYKAAEEIKKWESVAKGDYWYGSPAADEIEAFLKLVDPPHAKRD